MNIKILGPGCCNCQKLEENTKQALSELKMEAQIEKITDIEKIVSYGIISTPVLMIDEKVLFVGMVPDIKKIKETLEYYKESDKPAGTCSCGGNC